MTTARRQAKLKTLAHNEGYDSVRDMLSACITDCVAPAICINRDCGYTTEMEPDQDEGYCEVCGTSTVMSALVLARLI